MTHCFPLHKLPLKDKSISIDNTGNTVFNYRLDEFAVVDTKVILNLLSDVVGTICLLNKNCRSSLLSCTRRLFFIHHIKE